jgi:hypothetical protein
MKGPISKLTPPCDGSTTKATESGPPLRKPRHANLGMEVNPREFIKLSNTPRAPNTATNQIGNWMRKVKDPLNPLPVSVSVKIVAG